MGQDGGSLKFCVFRKLACFCHLSLPREWAYDCQPSTVGLVLVSLAAALILSTMLVYLLMRCACCARWVCCAVPALPAADFNLQCASRAAAKLLLQLRPNAEMPHHPWPSHCSLYAWKELRKRSYCHFKTNNM